MTAGYQLIDFGRDASGVGVKLEALGDRIIERPSPAAERYQRKEPSRWVQADSTYDYRSKNWIHRSAWPEDLLLPCGPFVMPVSPTPFGHIGLFPEQGSNWDWLSKCEPAKQKRLALNLFAYTGASTMALTRGGFEVVHVDAAKPNVEAAQRAAAINAFNDSPIRFIVDDAIKFVAREIRRGRRYHTIVLDPPAYGHSPTGKTWRLERDLWPLLDNCMKLVDPIDFRLLITGHSPQVDSQDVIAHVRSKLEMRFESGRMTLGDLSGRKLDAGFYVRAETCRQ